MTRPRSAATGLTCRICRQPLDRAATRLGTWTTRIPDRRQVWVETGATRTHPTCQPGGTP